LTSFAIQVLLVRVYTVKIGNFSLTARNLVPRLFPSQEERAWERGWTMNLIPISFPDHARSQVKGGHSSGEIELIHVRQLLQNINKVSVRISRLKFDTFYTEIN
jgi:hypothetical protein